MTVIHLGLADIGDPVPPFQQPSYSTGIFAKNQTVLEIPDLGQNGLSIGGKGVRHEYGLQTVLPAVGETQPVRLRRVIEGAQRGGSPGCLLSGQLPTVADGDVGALGERLEQFFQGIPGRRQGILGKEYQQLAFCDPCDVGSGSAMIKFLLRDHRDHCAILPGDIRRVIVG